MSEATYYIGQRIWRISYDQNQRFGSGVVDLRDDVVKNRPMGSLRSVAPPPFSLTPAVMITTEDLVKSE